MKTVYVVICRSSRPAHYTLYYTHEEARQAKEIIDRTKDLPLDFSVSVLPVQVESNKIGQQLFRAVKNAIRDII